MTPQDIAAVIIVVFCIAFSCGVFVGSTVTQNEHREYCNCRHCKRWRDRLMYKATLKDSKDE